MKRNLFLTAVSLLFVCITGCGQDYGVIQRGPIEAAKPTPHINKGDSLAMVAINHKIGPWLRTWNDGDIMTWGGVGIALDEATNEYRIVEFNAGTQNYHGTFPEEFRQLDQLRVLIVSGGTMYGKIPSWIGDLTNLTYLYIGTNNMSGHIPSEIGNLTNLTWLQIQQCQVDGPLPETLGNLKNLKRLMIEACNVYGEIPKSLANLKDSMQIYFEDTKLSGTFPIEILSPKRAIFCSGCNITELPFEVWSDNFIGIIPDLQVNRLSGTLPDSVLNSKRWNRYGGYVGRQQKGYGYNNYYNGGYTDATIN